MAELTDATTVYLLVFIVLFGGAVAAGVVFDEYNVTGTTGGIVLGLFGFVAGNHVSSNQTEWLGVLVVTGGMAAVVAHFLPFQLIHGVAVFLIGYVIGMQTSRRR